MTVPDKLKWVGDGGRDVVNKLTNSGTTSYEYSPANELLAASSEQGTVSRYYSYDTSGNIVSEYVQGASGPEPVVRYIRDTSGKAISMLQYHEPRTTNSEPITYYFTYNGHGDVTALTDSTGEVVATYSYDEFGNQTSSNDNGIYNPLRYSGANNAYYDTETGMYKMGVRYYQPDVGRWLTRDSYKGEQENPQTKNKYIYVENDPVNKVDSTGFWGQDVHYSMTFEIALNYFGPRASNAIAVGSYDMDNSQNHALSGHGHLQYHFNFNGSLRRRFNRCYGTAQYFLKKKQKNKALWWLGMGLHSVQDSYSHPPGYIGVALHGGENAIVMGGRYGLFLGAVPLWYFRYGSIYDEPKNNRENYTRALINTNKQIYRFWRYASRITSF